MSSTCFTGVVIPYIKVVNGFMQEFNAAGVNTGKVSGIGLNAHAYLERRQWSATAPLAPEVEHPDYSTDLPYLAANGFKYIQVMVAPFNGRQAAGTSYQVWDYVVGEPRFATDNTVVDLRIQDKYLEARQPACLAERHTPYGRATGILLGLECGENHGARRFESGGDAGVQ
jgi:hypothetical protein